MHSHSTLFMNVTTLKGIFSLSSRIIHFENQLFETYKNCTFKIVIHFWILTPTLKNEKVYFQSRWLLFSMVCIGFISSTTTVYWNCLCDLGPNNNNIIMLLNYLLRCLNLNIISEQNKAFSLFDENWEINSLKVHTCITETN